MGLWRCRAWGRNGDCETERLWDGPPLEEVGPIWAPRDRGRPGVPNGESPNAGTAGEGVGGHEAVRGTARRAAGDDAADGGAADGVGEAAGGGSVAGRVEGKGGGEEAGREVGGEPRRVEGGNASRKDTSRAATSTSNEDWPREGMDGSAGREDSDGGERAGRAAWAEGATRRVVGAEGATRTSGALVSASRSALLPSACRSPIRGLERAPLPLVSAEAGDSRPSTPLPWTPLPWTPLPLVPLPSARLGPELPGPELSPSCSPRASSTMLDPAAVPAFGAPASPLVLFSGEGMQRRVATTAAPFGGDR